MEIWKDYDRLQKISNDIIWGCLAELEREGGRVIGLILLSNPFTCMLMIANDMEGI